MNDTPETQEAIERWRQGKINIFDEMARLERERNQWMECAKAFATTVIAAPDMQFVPAMRRYEKLKEATQ